MMLLKRRRVSIKVVLSSLLFLIANRGGVFCQNNDAPYPAQQPNQPLRLPLPPEFANSAITSAVPVGVSPSFQQSHEEKPGSCPQSVSVRDYGWCVSQCRTDMNCSYDHKCCFNGCGTMCMQPVSASAEVDFLPPSGSQNGGQERKEPTLPTPIQQEPFGPPPEEPRPQVTPQRYSSGAQVIWNTAKPSAPATFNGNKRTGINPFADLPAQHQCPPTNYLPRSCEVQCNQDIDCGGQGISSLCCSSGCGKLCIMFSAGSGPKWQVGKGGENSTSSKQFGNRASVSYVQGNALDSDSTVPVTLEPEYKVLPRTSDKPGACPSLGYGTGGCVQTCSSDQDCEYFYKCCSNGCTMRCVRPIFNNQDDSVANSNNGMIGTPPVTQPPMIPSTSRANTPPSGSGSGQLGPYGSQEMNSPYPTQNFPMPQSNQQFQGQNQLQSQIPFAPGVPQYPPQSPYSQPAPQSASQGQPPNYQGVPQQPQNYQGAPQQPQNYQGAPQQSQNYQGAPQQPQNYQGAPQQPPQPPQNQQPYSGALQSPQGQSPYPGAPQAPQGQPPGYQGGPQPPQSQLPPYPGVPQQPSPSQQYMTPPKQDDVPFAPVTLSWSNVNSGNNNARPPSYQQPPAMATPPTNNNYQQPQMPFVPGGYGGFAMQPTQLPPQQDTQTSLPFVPGMGYGNQPGYPPGPGAGYEPPKDSQEPPQNGGEWGGQPMYPPPDYGNNMGYPGQVPGNNMPPQGYDNSGGSDMSMMGMPPYEFTTRRRRRRTTTAPTPMFPIDFMTTTEQQPFLFMSARPPTTTAPPATFMVSEFTNEPTTNTMAPPDNSMPEIYPGAGPVVGPFGSRAGGEPGAGAFPSPNAILAQQGVVVPETCIVHNQSALDPNIFTMAGSYLQIFTSIPITCTGQIVAWQFVRFAVDPEASFHASVWRRVNSRKLEFELIGSNRIMAGKDRYKKWKTYVVPRDQRIDVKIGQYLGIFYDSVNTDESRMVVPYLDGELAPGNATRLIEAGVAMNTDMREFEEIKLVSNGLVRVTFDLVLNRWRLPALVAYVLPKDDSDNQKVLPMGSPIFGQVGQTQGQLYALPPSPPYKRIRASVRVNAAVPGSVNRPASSQVHKPPITPAKKEDSGETSELIERENSSEMPQLSQQKPQPTVSRIFALKQPQQGTHFVQISRGVASAKQNFENINEEESDGREEESDHNDEREQESTEPPIKKLPQTQPTFVGGARQQQTGQQLQQNSRQISAGSGNRAAEVVNNKPQTSSGSFAPWLPKQQQLANGNKHRTSSVPAECLEMVDPGSCRTQIVRYYYDTSLDVCKPFIFTGCGGNSNNFRTPSECEHSCKQRNNQGSHTDFIHHEEDTRNNNKSDDKTEKLSQQ